MAALYDVYQDETGNLLYSYTVITTPCSPSLEWLHDRMPAILADDHQLNAWLGAPTVEKALALLVPFSEQLDAYPVSAAVGKVSEDSPENIVQIIPPPKNQDIRKFFKVKEKAEPDQKIKVESTPTTSTKKTSTTTTSTMTTSTTTTSTTTTSTTTTSTTTTSTTTTASGGQKRVLEDVKEKQPIKKQRQSHGLSKCKFLDSKSADDRRDEHDSE